MIKKFLLFIAAFLITQNAYAYNIVQLNPEYFPNPDKGKPVSLGEVYVGEPDTDPTVVANQKTLSVQEEDGTITVVSQPITLGAGGVPLYNGSPVTLLTDGDYSLTVLSSAGSQIYYTPSDVSFIGLNYLSSQGCDLGATIAASTDRIVCDCVTTLTDGDTDTIPITTTWQPIQGCTVQGVSGGGTETININGPIDAPDGLTWVGDNITINGAPQNGKISINWRTANITPATTDMTTAIQFAVDL